ncbi:MAG TPA: non-canonical purine NTP pyrophosphatase [Candidatus Saccharimonadales bacterium]|nr:non-canonical purine NTP pyrophosphatase [Candidatus Saccharimonadales bacterium]
MTREIIFATGNSGKVASLKRSFAIEGLDISVLQQPLDLIEPQAHTAAEVAAVKANQAYSLLGKPVLVDDSSFHISALGGFPGPYIKFMLETVGVEGIMNFMVGKEDRSAYFMSSLVFIDEKGEAHVFNGQDEKGVIVETIDAYNNPNAWSDLWKIFAPPGYTKTYSQMSDTELRDHRRKDKKNNAYRQFTEWLKENEATV